MALETLSNWREKREGGPDDLVFASWTGKPMSDGYLRRRVIYPTCDRLRIPRVNWHGFRHLHDHQAQPSHLQPSGYVRPTGYELRRLLNFQVVESKKGSPSGTIFELSPLLLRSNPNGSGVIASPHFPDTRYYVHLKFLNRVA
jgi:hypothetical protein